MGGDADTRRWEFEPLWRHMGRTGTNSGEDSPHLDKEGGKGGGRRHVGKTAMNY